MLIDSGADVNALSEEDWCKLFDKHNEGTAAIKDLRWGNGRRTLTAFGSSETLPIEATFEAEVVVCESDHSTSASFFVVRGAQKSLLGRESAIALEVLSLGLEINSCEAKPVKASRVSVFPIVPNELVHFDIDNTVTPTKNAYFNVPARFREEARARLNEMMAQGIIEEVVSAPRWISGMSLVPKGKSDFRLVVNMRGPNKAIQRSFHHLPTVDEMKVQLAGAAIFTKLDIKNAFHHLELDEESRELTTFQTESGMRRFTRLMFGVNCAPEIFQRMMERKLTGIEGVIVFIDDVLIYAPDTVSLRKQTNLVKKALGENNLTLNEEKCEYEKKEIKFLGHQLSGEGFGIDESKVHDVKVTVRPKNEKDLRSFIGLASYLSEYVQNFADLVAPLWKVAANKPFQWTQEAEDAFKATKRYIEDCTTRLSFFDESANTIVYADASPHALGAVLVQEKEGQPRRVIAFASKTLSTTEKAYPHVQKEALGVVWAVERFYYYLLGREFTIRTDACGITFIFDRVRTVCKRALNRAEGWALRLSGYSYKIEWIKGKVNIADSLSRLCLNPQPFSRKHFGPSEICSLSSSPNASIGRLTLDSIRIATNECSQMKKLAHAIATDEWPSDLEAYQKIRDELRVVEGYITRTGSVIIPPGLRSRALEIAHAGHPGESAMKSILRGRFWWPRMPTDAEEHVKNCERCMLTSRSERPVPLRQTILPDEPWQNLAIDFNGPHAACGGRSILVLVDYYSRFVVAKFVKSTDIGSVVPTLQEVFGMLGNPAAIRSDNGPPFNGEGWKVFCDDRSIKREFSTPAHPQQNGLVERYMQMVNKTITIAVASNENCEKALAQTVEAHNAATQRTTNVAPEILLFGRRRRGRIPIYGKTLVKVDTEVLRNRDLKEKAKTHKRENKKRGAKLTTIRTGDEVLLKRSLKAKDQTRFGPTRYQVVSENSGDFTIKGSDGRVFNRNVTHLKRVSKGNIVTPNVEPVDEIPRPKRRRFAPAHLSDYIRTVVES